MKGQLSYSGRGMAAVGVVELDEGIEAVLGVCIALSAFENLVGRGCFVWFLGVWPFQQLYVVGVRGHMLMLGVAAPLSCGLKTWECMTA